MNLQSYAAHRKAQGLRGASHVAVLKAIESGRLTEPAVRKVNGRWQIDAQLADREWALNTDTTRASEESMQRSEAVLAPQRKAAAEQEPEQPAALGPSLAQAKRAIAVYQAELARITVMREKDELVLAEEVKGEAARLARQVRDLLLIIPSRNAAQVAAMGDPEEVRALLQGEIEGALRGLAGG
jgi:hypothetical protein